MINKYKIAIIHYWLDDYRGGEKVVNALCEMFPTADIYTHIYKTEQLPKTITAHKVFTTFISKLPFAKKFYRYYLPLMPIALLCLNLKKYDLIISSESGLAKGIRKRKDELHICYCHSPMRYIWDMKKEYIQSLMNHEKLVKKRESGAWNRGSTEKRSVLRKIKKQTFSTQCSISNIIFSFLWKVTACYMRWWDKHSAKQVDYFIANSKFIAARIKKFYKRKSVIIHPPVNVEKFNTGRKRKDFYLCVSVLVSYKKVDIVVKAFNLLNLPLTVIGKGPELSRIKSIANDNIKLLGYVNNSLLTEKLETCKAFVFAGKEDFGIVFTEALSAGSPVITYGKGGAKDIIKKIKQDCSSINKLLKLSLKPYKSLRMEIAYYHHQLKLLKQ